MTERSASENLTPEKKLPEEVSSPASAPALRAKRRDDEESIAHLIGNERAALEILSEIEAESDRPSGKKAGRPAGQPAFILHTYPWSESSLVLDAFTARFGRLLLIARGAKRPGSTLKGMLMPFVPLKLSWTGRKEAKILTRADWLGILPPQRGEALLSGFYVNELLMRLTEREDVHPGLFTAYVRVLEALTLPDPAAQQRGLRRFEAELLRICGWRVLISEGEEAPRFALRSTGDLAGVSGTIGNEIRTWERRDVLDVLAGRLERSEALRAAREIYREAIELRLDGRPLRTRRVLAELKRL